ncbi:hypothetical protein ACQ4PT_012969 [Festuca glaucescens]
MAPPSLPKKREVRLPENEELAGKLLEKYRSMMADQPGSLSEPVRIALSAAYRGLCASKEPIRTLRDLLRTKGVGPWAILIMKDSFPATSPDLSPQEGKKRKYVPRKKSSAYAIVITLYRAMIRGNDSLMKQELIDAAEVSGLSASGIGPNNTRAKLGSSIKTLISKALVVKGSNPAKWCTKRNVLDNLHSQCRIPVQVQCLVAGRTIRIGRHKVYVG